MEDGKSAGSDESGGDEESLGCEEDVGGGEGGSRGGSPELAEISGRSQGLWMREREWRTSRRDYGWRRRDYTARRWAGDLELAEHGEEH